MWKAIGAVGGPTAVKFLEDKVTGPNNDDAALAVRALQERRDPAVLPFALKVASDPKADKIVRDEMFGVIETIGGLEAQRGLLGIISSDQEEMVRYRAFESALSAGKADGNPARRSRPSRPARLQEGRRRRSAGQAHREARRRRRGRRWSRRSIRRRRSRA